MTTGGPILPPATLAVLGGGQLGRMFVQAAQSMGYRTLVVADDADDPAAQVAHEVVVGRSDSLDSLREVAARADAVTVEFENVSAAGLRWLGRTMPARPGWQTVWVSQNRLREKTFLTEAGFPLAPWRPVRTDRELAEAVEALGLPMILKTAASGYDGKGQIRIERRDECESAWASLGRVACVAEAVVRFAAEVSVVAARGADGSAVAYPPSRNRHARHILDSSMTPAPIGPSATSEATDLTLGVLAALGAVGVVTVEFFLSEDGSLAINEIAPTAAQLGARDDRGG